MKLKHILILLTTLLILTGCVIQQVEQQEQTIIEERTQETTEVIQEVIEKQEIGGKYNLTLEVTNITVGERSGVMKKLTYTKDGETIDPDQALPDHTIPGLDWIKQNTPEDSKIMCWWDYGHAIRAYSEREPIADAPSKEILTTTVAKHLGKSPDEIDCPTCAEHQTIQDIAKILLAKDSNKAIEIMNEYNTEFLYIHKEDRSKSMAFFIALDREPNEEDLESTILEKAINTEPIEGFELVYEDVTVRIYRIKK